MAEMTHSGKPKEGCAAERRYHHCGEKRIMLRGNPQHEGKTP
jgi:hypothetical protein